MHDTLSQNPKSEALEVGKAPFQVIKGIREAILDGTFKPGDRLLEANLGERFKVSRSPVREALFALENEGTAVMVPYKGAIVKPLSPEEVLDIGELRLAVIALVAKPAHHHLSPADFELLDGLDPPTGALQRNHAAVQWLLAWPRGFLHGHVQQQAGYRLRCIPRSP